MEKVIHGSSALWWRMSMQWSRCSIAHPPGCCLLCWKTLAGLWPLSMQWKSLPQLSVEALAFPEPDSGTILLPAEHLGKVLSIFRPRSTKELRLSPNWVFRAAFHISARFLHPSTRLTLLCPTMHLGFFRPLVCPWVTFHVDEGDCVQDNWLRHCHLASLSLSWTRSLSKKDFQEMGRSFGCERSRKHIFYSKLLADALSSLPK